MQFDYRAYNSNGEIVTGVLEGASDHEVIEKLGEKDLMVVSLTQATLKPGRGRMSKIKVPLIVLAPATRELATMIRAGLSLVRCLGALERQSNHRDLQLVLRELSRFIGGGSSFSEALRVFPSVFSPVYIAMVTAGENAGLLAEVLDRMASYLEMSLRLRQRVRSAMMYPIIVGCVGVGDLHLYDHQDHPGIRGHFPRVPPPTAASHVDFDRCQRLDSHAPVGLLRNWCRDGLGAARSATYTEG